MRNTCIVLVTAAVIGFSPRIGLVEEHRARRQPLSRPTVDVRLFEEREATSPGTGNQYTHIERQDLGGGLTNLVFAWQVSKEKKARLETKTPIALTVLVKARVSLDSRSGRFIYEYDVQNHPSSIQDLYRFVVEAFGKLSSVTFPDEGWARWRRLESGWRRGEPLVGVDWADTDKYPRCGFKPGERGKPFGFESALLPGVVRCFVQGYVPVPQADDEVPPEVMDVCGRIGRLALDGRTVGPSIAPDSPTEHLVKILEMAKECTAEGWILPEANKQVLKTISTAKTLISIGDIAGARRSLLGLSEQLEKMQEEGGVLDEAYFILRFNLERLESDLK